MEDVTAATARRAEGFTFRSLKTFGTVETAPLLSGCRHHCQIESQNSSITWTPNGVCTNGGQKPMITRIIHASEACLLLKESLGAYSVEAIIERLSSQRG